MMYERLPERKAEFISLTAPPETAKTQSQLRRSFLNRANCFFGRDNLRAAGIPEIANELRRCNRDCAWQILLPGIRSCQHSSL